MEMIDLHAHILPNADDGSQSLKESLQMVRMAQQCGVRIITATPHCNMPGRFQNYISPKLEEELTRLRIAVKEEGLTTIIAKGAELFATLELPELLRTGKVWTLNDTRYFLVEFDFFENPEFCNVVLEECAMYGFIPIIAHPERYAFVQRNPEIAYDWYCQGYGIQINKGSILGRFGQSSKELGLLLLQHGLVSCVASDAHTAYMRTPHMAEVQSFLDMHFGVSFRHKITKDIPARILSGQPMDGLKPVPFKTRYFG